MVPLNREVSTPFNFRRLHHFLREAFNPIRTALNGIARQPSFFRNSPPRCPDLHPLRGGRLLGWCKVQAAQRRSTQQYQCPFHSQSGSSRSNTDKEVL